MVWKSIAPLACVVACLSIAVGVQGQDEIVAADAPAVSRNNSYTIRGLTLEAGVLRIDLAPADRALRNFNQGFGIGKIDGFDDTIIDLRVGAAYGVIPNLEVGAVVLPLGLAPSGRDTFGNPILYGRYQFLGGNTQVAGQISLTIPVQSGTDFGISLDVPVKFQLSDTMHVNTGVSFPILFADDTVVGLNIPVEFAVNVLPAVFLGANTGFRTNLTPNGFDPAVIPLGVFGGYTLDVGSNMALDLQAGFNWFTFLGFGDSRADAVEAGSFEILLGATLYVDVAG